MVLMLFVCLFLLYLIPPIFGRQLDSNFLFKLISLVIILSGTTLSNHSFYGIYLPLEISFASQKLIIRNIREYYSNTKHVCFVRPLCLGMEISCFVYRMERRKAVVGPSGLKEMKCTW